MYTMLCIYLLITTAAYGMYDPLHDIEKEFVLRELNRFGKYKIINDVNSIKNPNYIQTKNSQDYSTPTLLHINAIFHKSDIKRGSLEETVFNYIAKIEAQSGYVPEKIVNSNGFIIKPTNFLGDKSRYYWLGEKKNMIHVEIRIINEPALIEIVDSYDPLPEKHTRCSSCCIL